MQLRWNDGFHLLMTKYRRLMNIGIAFDMIQINISIIEI